MTGANPILGVGSGLELSSMLNQLLAVERIPLTRLQSQESSAQSTISALGALRNVLTTFSDAAKTLTPAKFNGSSATSTDTQVATVAAGNDAAIGRHTLAVDRLATAEKMVAAAQPPETALRGGALSIQFGIVDGGSFTPDGASRVLAIQAGSTLAEIRNAINADDKLGLSASIIHDGEGERLMLSARSTGAASAFRLTTSEAGDDEHAGLGFLDYDPANALDYEAGVPQDAARRLLRGADAAFTLDGIAITSSTNTVGDVLEGLTLNLAGTGSTDLNIRKDPNTAQATLNGLITAYNSMLANVNQLALNVPGEHGGTSGLSGPLAGNSVVRDVMSAIRSELFTPLTGAQGPFTSLSALGIAFKSDGTLVLDEDSFKLAMDTDAEAVARLFEEQPFGEDSIGLSARLTQTITRFTESEGAIDAQVEGLEDTVKTLQDQQESMSFRLKAIETRYRTQFAALDALVASLNNTSTYLTQQLDSIAAIRNSTK